QRVETAGRDRTRPPRGEDYRRRPRTSRVHRSFGARFCAVIQKAEETMSDTPVGGLEIRRLGILAGNGQLPFEALKEALSAGLPVTVAAIKEETELELEKLARSAGGRVNFHWIGVGQLGRLLK